MSGQIHDVPTAMLVKELRRRGADVGVDEDGVFELDFDDVRRCLLNRDPREALWALEKALPPDFAGFAETIIQAAAQSRL